jgi:hypothetical protein
MKLRATVPQNFGPLATAMLLIIGVIRYDIGGAVVGYELAEYLAQV